MKNILIVTLFLSLFFLIGYGQADPRYPKKWTHNSETINVEEQKTQLNKQIDNMFLIINTRRRDIEANKLYSISQKELFVNTCNAWDSYYASVISFYIHKQVTKEPTAEIDLLQFKLRLLENHYSELKAMTSEQ